MSFATNERVGEALLLLTQGLCPYVEAKMKARHGNDWLLHAIRAPGTDLRAPLDAYGLLKTMLKNWQTLFGNELSRPVRNFVSQALDGRNAWAHPIGALTPVETVRALDAIAETLNAINAKPLAAQVRSIYEKQIRSVDPAGAPAAKPNAQGDLLAVSPVAGRPKPLPPKPPPTPAHPNENMKPTEARRRVNQRCRLAVLNRSNTHFANISQARPDIWWFDIPLKKVEGPHAEETIHLLLYDNRSDEIHHLRVPSSYLRKNVKKPEPSNLRIRPDTKAIDLYLSTDNSNLFQDLHSKCLFQHLVCECSGRRP